MGKTEMGIEVVIDFGMISYKLLIQLPSVIYNFDKTFLY